MVTKLNYRRVIHSHASGLFHYVCKYSSRVIRSSVTWHYQGSLWEGNRWYWLFSAVTVGWWVPPVPTLIYISTDQSPLYQALVKSAFVHLWSEHVFINSLKPSDAYIRHQPWPSLVQIMDCRLFGARPFSEPMLYYCQLDL